jgi:NhaP-type Na+/H+ or K+/H+ antiporter
MTVLLFLVGWCVVGFLSLLMLSWLSAKIDKKDQTTYMSTAVAWTLLGPFTFFMFVFGIGVYFLENDRPFFTIRYKNKTDGN